MSRHHPTLRWRAQSKKRIGATIMRKENRRYTAAAVVAALGVSLAACTSADSAPDAGGDDLESVRISMGVDPSFAPLYIADQEGLFEEAGLSVEFVETEGGPAAVQNVGAGIADIAITSDVATLSAQNSKLKAVAVFQETGDLFKVVLREGVSPADIRSMAYFPGLGHYITLRYLESQGLDPDAIELISAGPPEFPAILGNGDADGYIVFEPWVSRGVEQGGEVVGSSADFDTEAIQWVVANGDWLAANEETAAKVVAVLDRASELVEADQASAVDAAMQAIQVDEKIAASAIEAISFDVRGFTPSDYEAVEGLVQFLEGIDVLDKPIDLQQVMLADWFEQNVESRP
ncbi:ABC transporter substrate-binding protein [Georgenia yuyongxinii]|uniref:ABC transporter substrate-binding protein n=2 Tax=Georgenia yuyongxinii TaxID=2589797 RepID=A0A5B8C8J4_9MICO|nr:ABC transporter substrate-binding protein [Georgenia yuyongxinii]